MVLSFLLSRARVPASLADSKARCRHQSCSALQAPFFNDMMYDTQSTALLNCMSTDNGWLQFCEAIIITRTVEVKATKCDRHDMSVS